MKNYFFSLGFRILTLDFLGYSLLETGLNTYLEARRIPAEVLQRIRVRQMLLEIIAFPSLYVSVLFGIEETFQV